MSDDPKPSEPKVKKEKLLLKAAEAAELLSIAPRTLWEKTNAGVIPCVRIGKLLRYNPDSLRRWILGLEK